MASTWSMRDSILNLEGDGPGFRQCQREGVIGPLMWERPRAGAGGTWLHGKGRADLGDAGPGGGTFRGFLSGMG